MNAELLDKIDKFRLMVGLKTGFVLDAEDHNAYYFTDHMEALEQIEAVRKDPSIDIDLAAAVYAKDQGLTLADFSEWWEYQEQLAEQRRELEEQEEKKKQAEFEKTIPELVKLKTTNQLQQITSKHYPKHYHFKFVRKTGKQDVEITGRVFNPHHGRYRLWYEFKNPTTQKKERHMVEGNTYWFNCPKWFPDWWKGRWSITHERIAMAFAYAMTSTWSKEFTNIVKPK